MPRTTLVWFLQDLRLADQPALAWAAESSDTVVPLFLWTPAEHGDWLPGAAARAWLRGSLVRLDADLRSRGSKLVVRRAPAALAALRRIAREVGADAVTWNARYEPALRIRDRAVAHALRHDGFDVRVFPSRLLHDPRRILTAGGAPYRVFSAFWRRMQEETTVGAEIDRPRLGRGRAPAVWPAGEPIDDPGLLGDGAAVPASAVGSSEPRQMLDLVPGEAAAQRRLRAFIERDLSGYEQDRDRMDLRGTSRLSPHLCHGEVSPRQVWNAVASSVTDQPSRRAADAFLRQLAWREFAWHLLFHFPHTTDEPLREQFASFPWRVSPDGMRAWQQGATGYPVVDAAMRQLLKTGWMHNRARMIVASFLTKHLMIPWQDGARWFWERLLDADLANNTLGWQWSAGCGADAQPFFRIFNPEAQGRKFDPGGDYVRTWVPELAEVPAASIHGPRRRGKEAAVDDAAGYPGPIVDHREARSRALAAWNGLR